MRTAILLLATALLLTGCVNITINHTLNEDGTGTLEIVYDMPEEMRPSEDEACEDSPPTFQCAFDNQTGSLTLTKDLRVPNDYYTQRRGLTATYYILDATYALEILESIGTEEETAEEVLEGISQVGGKATYNVLMPHTIIEADAGTITERQVVIDITKLERGTPTTITAKKEEGYTTIALGVLIVVIVISIILVLVYFRRHPHHKPAPERPQTNEERYKDYIQRYQTTYPKERIMQSLMLTGVEEREAKRLVDAYYTRS